MWDYNSGLLFLNLVVFPGCQEASCALLQCSFFDGPDTWLPPSADPITLGRHRLHICRALRGKLWFRLWSPRISDLVSSLLMKLLIWASMVFLLHGHLPTQHELEIIMMTRMSLPGHPRSLQDISANSLYQSQLENFFFCSFFPSF